MPSRGKNSQTSKGPVNKHYRFYETKKSSYILLCIKFFRYQKISDSKKSSPTYLLVLLNKIFSTLRIVHWYQKLSETPQGSTQELFLGKNFWHLFVIAPLWVIKKLARGKWAVPKTFRDTRNLLKHQKCSLTKISALWYCETKRSPYISVIPFYGLPKFSRRSHQQRWFWPVLNTLEYPSINTLKIKESTR